MLHSLSFFLLDNMADTQYLIRELLKIKDSVAQRYSIIKKTMECKFVKGGKIH